MTGSSPSTLPREHVVTQVTTYWRIHKKALPLSTLGHLLVKQQVDVRSLLGNRKMADVLRDEFADELTVQASQYDNKILGVIPKTATPSAGRAFHDLGRPDADAPASVPRLPAAAWVAFTKPIAPNMERLVSLEPHFSFQDTDQLELLQQPARKIGPDYISISRPEETKPTYAERVYRSAVRWCNDNGVPAEQVLARPKPTQSNEKSLLDRLLEALSAEQMKRCIFPLDVVETLRKS